jgi:hypothetical protein
MWCTQQSDHHSHGRLKPRSEQLTLHISRRIPQERVGGVGHAQRTGFWRELAQLPFQVFYQLPAGGITAGTYNLPGWEGGIEGLYTYLDSSFQRTPPTAIIAGSSPNYFATLHFLLSRGIRVPQDCSLVCVDDDPHFQQYRPSVAHIHWRPTLHENRESLGEYLRTGQDSSRRSPSTAARKGSTREPKATCRGRGRGIPASSGPRQ